MTCERLPHPHYLEGARVDLLKHIHEWLDNCEEGRITWLHSTTGVGESVVAVTVAERMSRLKMTNRLAGTFFFSRAGTQLRVVSLRLLCFINA
ncbi:uncharacterized protein BJ212DRAFT_1379153 [Suillus subaureus]|uniref:Nephrocystin 3-like N-terminal domain-containing protein n=1 Tax=Suillus subaureus TaxID=48587 RepID=A0A9P7E394_9AGAM|nr:uncharacterized protein BJ212DRAFT_1379153 [Suillus subaureus]KAG1809699.1 hypothetical protein BJ212DRAFT_1379153 [Suillus subaureus]